MDYRELIIKDIIGADCKHCFFYNEGQEDCNFTILSTKGILSCWLYSSSFVGGCNVFIEDDEFLSIVKNLAKERLNDINKQIEEL